MSALAWLGTPRLISSTEPLATRASGVIVPLHDRMPVLLEAAELTHAGNPLIDGLILVRTQLLQTLQEEGLERIPVVGLPYDPGVSEAVETRAVTDPEEHHVVLRDLAPQLAGRVVLARAVRTLVIQGG